VELLLEPFAYGFQQRALIGGLISGFMASIVGTWLVLRGMSFFGDAFVHGVVPGIAVAVLIDINPLIGAAAAALVMVILIEVINRSTTLSADTSIGLLFVGMLSLGVILISRSDSYSGNLTTILFGDPLGITWQNIYIQIGLGVIVLALTGYLYRTLVVMSFSVEKAELWGMKPGRAHFLLLILIAMTVIGSFQSVGTLLVFSLLIGPPATAALISKSIGKMMLYSIVFSAVAVWLGLTLSFYWSTASSATIAIIPVVFFFITLLLSRMRRIR
jgi:manganese/iron transport system permease protein